MKPLVTVLFMLGIMCSYGQQPVSRPDTTSVVDTTLMDEVILHSTRTSRTIQNEPTRIETIEKEEINEKNNMRPANVAMLLHESTGIKVQQTSATSANASIRIQGLDGKYTQLLKDGFPNYGNFSGGLSILEIPPLDLKQVEIIKGPASTLFGGGAIAGVVNFISRTPGEQPEFNFLINQSNVGHTNIGVYSSKRTRKAGYTILGLYNKQTPYDKDDDHFTEIPKSGDFTIHPTIFYYPNETTTIILGNSTTNAERTGGDLGVINRGPYGLHQFFEKNETTRSISTLELDKKFSSKKRLIVKQSFGVFTRSITMPFYLFGGISKTAFSELSYIADGNNQSIVAGANLNYDKFDEKERSGSRDNKSLAGGVFLQHTWDAASGIQLETGLRFDAARYSNSLFSKSESFLLPRISMLIKFNSNVSSRIGGGMGYKLPTLFTEETEMVAYKNLLQISNVHAEKSYGGTADINIKQNISDDLKFSINQMFFYTIIQEPLVLLKDQAGRSFFQNAAGNTRSVGFETNARIIFKQDLKLFLGYTFTHANALYTPGKPFLTLIPKGKLNSALIYEKEQNFKMGLEAYFTGTQFLSNGTQTPRFIEMGLMVEKTMGLATAFINFENFTNTRQSKYKIVSNGQHNNPSFDEIWTNVEGFVVNAGIKLKM